MNPGISFLKDKPLSKKRGDGQLSLWLKKTQIVLFSGVAITIILLLLNIYLAGIVFILLVTVVMSMLIMQDIVSHPDLDAELSGDAKSIILKNSGNVTALNIHVALVPMNTEYDLPSLTVDATHSYPFDAMVQNIKAVITYENEEKVVFCRSYSLSALGNEYKPFKPMIPLFKWK